MCCGRRREVAGCVFNVLGSSRFSQVGCSVLVKMALWFHLYRKGNNVPCEELLKGLVSCPGVLTCVSSEIKNPFFLIKLFH